MKVRNILSIAIVSVLLAACSSSSGSKSSPSIAQLPEKDREIVSKEKTASLVYNEWNGDIYRYTLDGKTDEYNFANLPNGRSELPVSLSYTSAQGNTGTLSGTMLIYQQPYSVITGITWTQGSGDYTGSYEQLNVFERNQLLGLYTPDTAVENLTAQNAIFDYTGAAFDGTAQQATLNYTMNFGSREGQGSITGFSHTGKIDLQAAKLEFEHINNSWFIAGDALIEKDPVNKDPAGYYLSFFGPNAEELAGEVYDPWPDGVLDNNHQIIFAGKRE